MIVVNKRIRPIKLDDVTINPNEKYEMSESIFDTHTIITDSGSCVIHTEYCSRSFDINSTALSIIETSNNDSHGMPIIEVSGMSLYSLSGIMELCNYFREAFDDDLIKKFGTDEINSIFDKYDYYTILSKIRELDEKGSNKDG